jgi:diguanylate cyclase (GGDEF)-like protein
LVALDSVSQVRDDELMDRYPAPTVEDHEFEPDTPVEVADKRDRMADGRDRTSELHDEVARARDARAEARDTNAQTRTTVDVGAALDRAESARDRRGADKDRSHAAADREASWSDRAVSAGERALFAIDRLTAAYSRDTGILEFHREIAKAKRTEQPFVLAFVDLDGLKATNDSLGHAAGDQRLRQTADTIRAKVRSYDLIVRFGGDEFVCGLPDLKMEEAAKRFLLVNVDLAETRQAPITVGLAELTAGDSLESLMARADKALYREREQRKTAS